MGGGIIGNSIAYHLAGLGVKDVILLEQQQLTSGTTWQVHFVLKATNFEAKFYHWFFLIFYRHAAGLMVTYGSLSESSTEIRKYTKKLYSELEQETGQSTGFKPVGFIELASDADRLEEFRRVAGTLNISTIVLFIS